LNNNPLPVFIMVSMLAKPLCMIHQHQASLQHGGILLCCILLLFMFYC